MVNLTRRAFTVTTTLGLSATALGFSMKRAAAAEYSLKFAFNLAETHPITTRAREAASICS